MSASARWADLAPRVLSGVILAVVGIAEIWVGGWIFAVTVWMLGAVMLWEAARMFGAPDAVRSGILGGVALALTGVVPGMLVLPLLLAAVLVAATQVSREKGLFVSFAVWVLLGCYAMVVLRGEAGLIWMLWLISVVITSDIAGYFAGRILGGPKFWPRVSPKKTWSGTIAGWLGAVIIGGAFAGVTGAGAALVVVSVVICFAAQMGDIAESAVKRRTGVKDSSSIIPGHGGVLDRFDGMLGAGILFLLLRSAGMVPGL